jgi:glucosamine--fructose-6-phosphate aminotransferase (isomerizing)
MCGIVGYTGTEPAVPILLAGLRRLEYRGYDSAGVAVHHPSREIRVIRSQGKLARLAQRLTDEDVAGTCGIGHTRWATHGRPTEDNAHPHRFRGVVVVHNGILENHLELRARLEARGHEFESETDTEIFAHLIALEFEAGGDLHAAVERALDHARGTWALAVLHESCPGEIVAARHGSPLLVGLGGPDANLLASDVAAILDRTRDVVDLEDGDTARIDGRGIVIHDGQRNPVQRPARHVDWSPVAAEKQGFKHFMLKEIHEQPAAVSDTLLGRMSLEAGAVHLDGLTLPRPARIVILACGTSFHAGLAGRYMIESLARIPVDVELASEFRYRDPIVSGDTLALAISQSGETADTLAALKEARRLGARTLALCNVVDSTIARAAEQVLYTHAGPEISVASTKAFTTQLAALALVACRLAADGGTRSTGDIRAILTGLAAVPEVIAGLVGASDSVRAIATHYRHARHMLFLGRHMGYPVALEGALKLKEVSYVHAEGFASGEMKHGPIALVDEHLPVVVIALQGPGYEKAVSNLQEVRARGGKIVALATVGDSHLAGLADDVIWIPDVHPIAQPIVATIPLQLLAYHTADLAGTDVDQPRNLAKSVTVE